MTEQQMIVASYVISGVSVALAVFSFLYKRKVSRLRRELEARREWEQVQDAACRFHLGVSRAVFLAGWGDGTYDWDHPTPSTSTVAILFGL